jgi:hypothetical protein
MIERTPININKREVSNEETAFMPDDNVEQYHNEEFITAEDGTVMTMKQYRENQESGENQ